MRGVVLALAAGWLLLVACGSSSERGTERAGASSPEPVVVSLADGSPRAATVIAVAESPADRLHWSGRVLDMDGRPLAAVAVVAYHTDRDGLYNRRDADTRVPRLRGVSVTDGQGRFAFSSIRPGAYPENMQPAHIHMIVAAPAHHVKHLEYWFDDDPLVTPERRAWAERSDATIVVEVETDSSGAASFRHDVRLEGN